MLPMPFVCDCHAFLKFTSVVTMNCWWRMENCILMLALIVYYISKYIATQKTYV